MPADLLIQHHSRLTRYNKEYATGLGLISGADFPERNKKLQFTAIKEMDQSRAAPWSSVQTEFSQ